MSLYPAIMTTIVRLFFVIAILGLCACEDPRIPLAEGQVLAIADMRLEHMQITNWGTAREVLKPVEPDESGRYLWTVHYPAGPEDELRVIFVNEYTQWAHTRTGKKGSAETVKLQPRSTAVAEQLQMQEGSMILIIAEDAHKDFTQEAQRLNILAQATGLLPQFSVRTFTAGSQLIYGWTGEHGMQKNKYVDEWMELRTEYTDSRWLNFAP